MLNAVTLPRLRGPGGRRLRVAHLTTVDMSLDLLLGTELRLDVESGLEFASRIGYPIILRPSFTLGGTGGGIAFNHEELVEILERGLDLSPVHEVLIE